MPRTTPEKAKPFLDEIAAVSRKYGLELCFDWERREWWVHEGLDEDSIREIYRDVLNAD